MKKNKSIIFLSIFALAMSVFGFMGIQPVKASTLGEGEGAITVKDTDIQFKGASLDWAEEVFDEEKGITTSGDGRLKFYSSYSTDLITALEGKTYTLGTLVARAEDFANYEDVIFGATGVINVETKGKTKDEETDYDYKRLYNSGAENEVTAWWTMVSVNKIPRAYYGVQLIARPYVEVDGKYAYAAYDESKNYAYSLATTAQMKLDAGHFNVQDGEGLTSEGEKVRDTYTKFKVTFHFDSSNSDLEGYVPTKTYYLNYGDAIPTAYTVYSETHYNSLVYMDYRPVKGFYSKDGSYFAHMIGLSVSTGEVSAAVGGSGTDAQAYENDKRIPRVYGDMNLYEKVAPSNLLDDFSSVQSLEAAFTTDGEAGSTLYWYKNSCKDPNAKWHTTLEDSAGVVEKGVLEIPSHFDGPTRKSTHYFYLTSLIRNYRFWNGSSYDSKNIKTVNDGDAYYGEGEVDYDYLNFRILVKSDVASVKTVKLRGLYGLGNYADKNLIDVPVNTWVNLKIERGLIEKTKDAYALSQFRNIRTNSGGNLEIASSGVSTEGAFKLCIDYISYERDMRISVNGESGWNAVEYTGTYSQYYPYRVKYDPVTSYLGDEITLGTILNNGTVKYTVVGPDGETKILDNTTVNTFKPTTAGTYKVTATCDDYLLQGANGADYPDRARKSKQYGELEFEVLGREVGFTLKDGNDNEFNDLKDIKLGDTVKIRDITVDELDNVDVANATYQVKYLGTDPATDVNVVNGQFIANKVGDYTVVVKYNYNGIEFVSNATEISVVSKEVTAKFYVGENEIDINNVIAFDSIVTIKTYVDGVEVDGNLDYKVTHIDSKNSEKNYEFNAGNFKAGLTGTYNVQITYTEGEGQDIIEHKSQTIVLNVGSAPKEYFNDFSDSASTYASYKLGLTATNGADSQYKKVLLTDTAENIANSIAPETYWHAEYNGKYGVIETKPQDIQNANGEYPNTNGALAVALRSYTYDTSAKFNSALNTVIYNGSYKADDAPTLAIRSPNWDYVSVWIYLKKDNATENETTNVYGIYRSLFATVKYNTWVEIKMDKYYVSESYGNRGIVEPFTSYNGRSFPTIFLATKASDAQYTQNQNVTVYVDSMSFAKYSTVDGYEGYTVERLEDIGLYDENSVKVSSTNLQPHVISYVKENGVYSPTSNTLFTLKAKANGAWVDSSKLEIMKGTQSLLSSASVGYKGEDGLTPTTLTAYDWYKINVSLATSTASTALTYKNASNSSEAQAMPRVRVRVKYVDEENKVVYIGYVAECFNSADVTPAV